MIRALRQAEPIIRATATIAIAATAIFEQGVIALGAALPPVQPIAFSAAWIAEAAILGLLYLALREGRCAR